MHIYWHLEQGNWARKQGRNWFIGIFCNAVVSILIWVHTLGHCASWWVWLPSLWTVLSTAPTVPYPVDECDCLHYEQFWVLRPLFPSQLMSVTAFTMNSSEYCAHCSQQVDECDCLNYEQFRVLRQLFPSQLMSVTAFIMNSSEYGARCSLASWWVCTAPPSTAPTVPSYLWNAAYPGY